MSGCRACDASRGRVGTVGSGDVPRAARGWRSGLRRRGRSDRSPGRAPVSARSRSGSSPSSNTIGRHGKGGRPSEDAGSSGPGSRHGSKASRARVDEQRPAARRRPALGSARRAHPGRSEHGSVDEQLVRLDGLVERLHGGSTRRGYERSSPAGSRPRPRRRRGRELGRGRELAGPAGRPRPRRGRARRDHQYGTAGVAAVDLVVPVGLVGTNVASAPAAVGRSVDHRLPAGRWRRSPLSRLTRSLSVITSARALVSALAVERSSQPSLGHGRGHLGGGTTPEVDVAAVPDLFGQPHQRIESARRSPGRSWWWRSERIELGAHRGARPRCPVGRCRGGRPRGRAWCRGRRRSPGGAARGDPGSFAVAAKR